MRINVSPQEREIMCKFNSVYQNSKILSIVCTLLWAAQLSCSPTTERAQLKKGVVELNGEVIRNVKKCTVDGPCFLDVKSDVGIVRVSYASPRGHKCSNIKAFEDGFKLEARQRIRVRGFSNGGSNLVMCREGSNEFFIKTIE